MRRLLILVLLAALFASAPPAHAQSDGEAPNRLSLEALTAPPPGGSSGGGYGRSRSYAHRGYGARRSSYGRFHRAPAHYHPLARFHARPGRVRHRPSFYAPRRH